MKVADFLMFERIEYDFVSFMFFLLIALNDKMIKKSASIDEDQLKYQ